MKVLKNFYCIEGIDGSGKTSIINELKKICKDYTIYHFTKEPTNSKIGNLIKEELINPKSILINNTLAYLYAADRYEHLYGKNGIIKNLKNKKKVISDRYLFSSLVYQGNIGKKLNKDFPLPEKLFSIKTDSEVAYKRILNNRKTDIFEDKKKLKYFDTKYKEVSKYFENKIKVIYLKNVVEKDLKKNALKIFNLINN